MEELKRFEEHFAKYGNDKDGMGALGYKIGAGLLVGFLQILMTAPAVRLRGTDIVVECFLSFYAGELFLTPYLIQQEDKREVSLYKKLAYVPVGRRRIQKLLISRLLRYVKTVILVTTAIQGFILLMVEQPKMWWNLPYAVLVVGVLPLLTGILRIYWRK